MSDRFAAEAEKHRAMYLFFPHTYYYMKERRNTATILLRESVTFAQLLKLNREESYAQLEPAEQLHRRKIFWLLFVTERGHALQHDVPFSLHNSIEMPKAEDDGSVLIGFLKLAHLFLNVDEILIGAHDRRGAASRAYTKELLANLQQQLSRIEEDPPYSNEVQKGLTMDLAGSISGTLGLMGSVAEKVDDFAAERSFRTDEYLENNTALVTFADTVYKERDKINI
jgi:hypothetical protein